MALWMCCLKLQSDWPGLCSEPVSTVVPRCRCVFIIQHTAEGQAAIGMLYQLNRE